jgi:hypothetical protein
MVCFGEARAGDACSCAAGSLSAVTVPHPQIKNRRTGTKGWFLATTSLSIKWEQILKEQLTCPIRSCGQETKMGVVSVVC